MSDLVWMHHNEPMTTSEAIAEGTGVQHKNVLELVRKFTSELLLLDANTVVRDSVVPDDVYVPIPTSHSDPLALVMP